MLLQLTDFAKNVSIDLINFGFFQMTWSFFPNFEMFAPLSMFAIVVLSVEGIDKITSQSYSLRLLANILIIMQSVYYITYSTMEISNFIVCISILTEAAKIRYGATNLEDTE